MQTVRCYCCVVRIAQAEIKSALMRYAHDRTNRFDYALESAGASVVSVRCTRTFADSPGVWNLFGIPLFFHHSDPRTPILGVCTRTQ